MRADRALSLYLFRPLGGLLPQNGSKVPILMYHRVPETDNCACHPYFCTNTSVAIFEQQIRFLRENGYRTVTVDDAFEAARNLLPADTRKLVAITFDDGYRDFRTNAFPILRRYGCSATVFLPTAYIGDSARRFKGAECMTWEEVRDLQKAGVKFGSHTVTHPRLRHVKQDQLQDELKISKDQMEQKLGEPVNTFSYPFAFPETDHEYVGKLEGLLRESGYQHGVSTILGRVSRSNNRFFMKRLPMNAHDDPALFRAKLNGAYDWLWAAQYASKLRRGVRLVAQPMANFL